MLLVLITSLITFIFIIYPLGKFLFCIFRASQTAGKATVFFERRNKGKPLIGVFGDSTGFGTGASSPEHTLAGLIGHRYPKSTIRNYSKGGQLVRQISNDLQKAKGFDILILCCGGVDTLYFRNYGLLEKDIQRLFAVAKNKAMKVILITPLNLGLSTAFPWFLKSVYLLRSNKVGRIFEEEAKQTPNIFVSNNLVVESSTQLPAWESISAPDRVHPNDKGYLLAFEKIRHVLN